MFRLLGAGETSGFDSAMGWNDPMVSFGRLSAQKVGSFQPRLVFCPRPNSPSRTAQPCCSSTLWFLRRVNEMVTAGVNRVFHAPVTLLSNLRLRRTTSIDQVNVKKDRARGLPLRDFGPQLTVTKLTQAPRSVEVLYFVALEALPRVSKKLEILRHRD